MNKKNKVVELAQELVKRQSYRDGALFEKPVLNFLCKYLKKNFPFLKIEKQFITKGRWNIFAYDRFPTKLLVIDHVDTVEPVASWSYKPLDPIIRNSRLYGLGSSDTKGSIAAFLTALRVLGETKGLAMLFYIDEEYDFLGMKRFTNSKANNSIFPRYIYSLDGDDMCLGLGCRGLIELKITLIGKTGHSAKGNGINVNTIFVQIINKIESTLKQFSDPYLGKTTLNIAKISSGCRMKDNQFSNQGNRIPDYLESIIEVRPASRLCSANTITTIIKNVSKDLGGICMVEITQDWQSFVTPKDKVSNISQIIKNQFGTVDYLNPATFGYLDVAQLQSVFPRAVIFSCGAGVAGQAHSPNEFVSVNNLVRMVNLNKAILQKLQIIK